MAVAPNDAGRADNLAQDPVKLIELDKAFFPKGAIAFFLALIAFFAMVWLSLYGMMIYRQGSL